MPKLHIATAASSTPGKPYFIYDGKITDDGVEFADFPADCREACVEAQAVKDRLRELNATIEKSIVASLLAQGNKGPFGANMKYFPKVSVTFGSSADAHNSPRVAPDAVGASLDKLMQWSGAKPAKA